MNILKTFSLAFLTLPCFAQKTHEMSDDYSLYMHEYEQELLSKLLPGNVFSIETFEQNFKYYRRYKEFMKSIRYLNHKNRDSLTIFKAIDGSILNTLTFKYAQNKIAEIVMNDGEDSISYSYQKNMIFYDNGSDSVSVELDSKNRRIKEVSDGIVTHISYNDRDKTKTTRFPSDFKDLNEIRYYTFNNGLIKTIKTVNMETGHIESDIAIEYTFEKKRIKEIIVFDKISEKRIRNVVNYR